MRRGNTSRGAQSPWKDRVPGGGDTTGRTRTRRRSKASKVRAPVGHSRPERPASDARSRLGTRQRGVERGSGGRAASQACFGRARTSLRSTRRTSAPRLRPRARVGHAPARARRPEGPPTRATPRNREARGLRSAPVSAVRGRRAPPPRRERASREGRETLRRAERGTPEPLPQPASRRGRRSCPEHGWQARGATASRHPTSGRPGNGAARLERDP